MLGHETLLGTVSRTLRDDFKKSMELTLYLLNIFQAYSNFSEFHEFLITNQIGDTTIRIIDHEIKRYVQRVKDFKDKTEKFKSLMGTEDYEAAQEELRKDEKKISCNHQEARKSTFRSFPFAIKFGRKSINREKNEK